jgi:hypothetical protein
MKKLFLILLALSFTGQQIIAQVSSTGSGKLYRNTGSGADRASGNSAAIFGTQADWSTDLMISEKSPASAANDYEGPSHSGMGATGWASFTAGAYNRSSGVGATALGFHNIAGPISSDVTSQPPSTSDLGGQFAVGYGTQATGHVAFTSGFSTIASGNFSTAMGVGATATDYGSFVIGSYNSSGSSATSATLFSTSVPAFVIGNGTSSNSKSDAFKVMFNGNTTVSNDLTVSGDVVVSSDARLKSNIVSLGSTLSRLLLIDGKSYIMKGKQKIGVLAQEIKEVFPELVSEDDNEMLAVNYQGLVPVLINALKEQDDKIKAQEKRLLILEKKITNLD